VYDSVLLKRFIEMVASNYTATTTKITFGDDNMCALYYNFLSNQDKWKVTQP